MPSRTALLAGLLLLIAGGAVLWKGGDAGDTGSVSAPREEAAKAKSPRRDARAPDPGGEAMRKIREASRDRSPEQALEGLRDLTLLHEKAVQEQLDLASRANTLDDGDKAALRTVSQRIEVLKDRFLESGECLKEAGADQDAVNALLSEHRDRLNRIAAIKELQEEEMFSR